MSKEVIVQTRSKCDLHAHVKPEEPAPLARYDGKTTMGPWAYMCESCWRTFGIGRLGTGFGQRLVTPEEAR